MVTKGAQIPPRDRRRRVRARLLRLAYGRGDRGAQSALRFVHGQVREGLHPGDGPCREAVDKGSPRPLPR